nr:hypothetical protein [Tanacetum cinerariifolium]
VTTEDMQKRKNDVKARTTLLLSLPDEHQLRFSKYKTAQKLWAAILKTFGELSVLAKTLLVLTLLALIFSTASTNVFNSGNEEVNTASVSTASTNVFPASANIRVASISQDTAYDYIASQSNDRGRRDNYRQGSNVEEHTPKALIAIDGVGWDWSFMANEQEDHALDADEEAPIEFALIAKTSAESEVEGRLAEFKNQEIKLCEKIRGLELQVEFKTNRIESLINELELLKKEKGELDTKLTGFQTASKNLDNLLESQRSDKNKEELGYSAVSPPSAQVYSPPKKDISWTGLPEFVDDTITNYSRPSPTVESKSDDPQNKNPSVTKTEPLTSTILSKLDIKFVKATDRTTETKTAKVETAKPTIKYAELYRKPSKGSKVRGDQRN